MDLVQIRGELINTTLIERIGRRNETAEVEPATWGSPTPITRVVSLVVLHLASGHTVRLTEEESKKFDQWLCKVSMITDLDDGLPTP